MKKIPLISLLFIVFSECLGKKDFSLEGRVGYEYGKISTIGLSKIDPIPEIFGEEYNQHLHSFIYSITALHNIKSKERSFKIGISFDLIHSLNSKTSIEYLRTRTDFVDNGTDTLQKTTITEGTGEFRTTNYKPFALNFSALAGVPVKLTEKSKLNILAGIGLSYNEIKISISNDVYLFYFEDIYTYKFSTITIIPKLDLQYAYRLGSQLHALFDIGLDYRNLKNMRNKQSLIDPRSFNYSVTFISTYSQLGIQYMF